jgi:hypothetical protein
MLVSYPISQLTAQMNHQIHTSSTGLRVLVARELVATVRAASYEEGVACSLSNVASTLWRWSNIREGPITSVR